MTAGLVTFLQTLPPEQIPSVFSQREFWVALLGAVVTLGGALIGVMKWVMGQVLRQNAAREIAQREEAKARESRIVATQDHIAGILDNHLGEIGRHMATTNEILRTQQQEGRSVQQAAMTFMGVMSKAIEQLQKSVDEHDRRVIERYSRSRDG